MSQTAQQLPNVESDAFPVLNWFRRRLADNPGDWLTTGRFAALLGVLIIATFPRVLWGSHVFTYLDFGQFAYPLAFYHRESFWHGEIPLWNPLSNCGTPFLAQWNTLTLYPLSLWYLLLPFPWSLGSFCLLHMLLAGIGMYRLAWRWTNHRLAASVAGAVFAFNGMTWYGLMWPSLSCALAWMPWVVLTMERSWLEGRRLIPVAAVVGAMQMLTGGVEVIIQTWLLLGVLWLAKVIRREASWIKLAGRALLSGCLVAGLSAAQLLPFFGLLTHSQRTAHYANAGLAAMPLSGLANYLIPVFHCFRNLQGIFVPPNHWTASYYLGIATVLFAVLAVSRFRNHLVYILAGLAALSVLLSFGERGLVYNALKQVLPPLGFVRFPIKFVMLATFVIPLLAAHGLAALLKARPEHWAQVRKHTLSLASGFLLVMVALLCSAWKHPSPRDDLAATVSNAAGGAFFLVAAVAGVLLLRKQNNPKRQVLLQLVIVVLLWGDVLRHNSNLTPTIPREVLAPDAVRKLFEWDQRLAPGIARVMEDRACLQGMVTSAFPRLELDTKVRRLSMFFNYSLLDHVPKFDGFLSLELKEFSDLFQKVYASTNNVPDKFLDFVGVCLSCSPTNLVTWTPRPTFLPVVTVGQKPVFADKAESLDALFGMGFEPKKEVYLPLEARGQVNAGQAPAAKATVTHFSAHRLAVGVEADAPAMLVVAQLFYPSWHAYVDEAHVPLWRANYAFQAVQVPPGKHQVNLVYEDEAFRYGTRISLASLATCLVTWIIVRSRITNRNS